MTTTAAALSEAEIQRRIEAALGAEPDLLLLKNSVGRANYVSDAGKPYTVPYGLGVGSPDLVGLLMTPAGFAAWFCIEVKRPGEQPTPAQLKCHAIWRRFGARVAVCTSVEEARAALADARKVVAA